MADNQKRTDFLKTKWVKYPSGAHWKHAGRIIAIDKSKIKLMGGQSVPLKQIKNWNELTGILQAGDIIGIQKNGTGVLLAPWRMDGEEPKTELILKKIERQKKWNHFLNAVNQFFQTRDFLAVQTPTLVDNPGPEPTIDVFKTDFKVGRTVSAKHLITSPELHLKKILSDSLCPVYEITKVFRNNEHSSKHKPEFWMLEWYRPFADLHAIQKDVKDLILFLAKTLKLKKNKFIFKESSYQQILKNKFNYDFQPDSDETEIKRWLKEQNIYFSEGMSLDDLFTLMNLEMVETNLDEKHIVFLTQYPPYAAALAKLDEAGWAQRFEVYWKGLELGNAFGELNDPDIQEQRLIEDNKKKLSNGLETVPTDTEFINSLKRGMPPSAGISIGLERLFMVLFDEDEIKNLTWF